MYKQVFLILDGVAPGKTRKRSSPIPRITEVATLLT